MKYIYGILILIFIFNTTCSSAQRSSIPRQAEEQEIEEFAKKWIDSYPNILKCYTNKHLLSKILPLIDRRNPYPYHSEPQKSKHKPNLQCTFHYEDGKKEVLTAFLQ